MLANDEIWFSNPLLMNDLEELRFGINLGVQEFLSSEAIRGACRSDARHRRLINAYQDYYNNLDQVDAFDTYALCFTEHDRDNYDGLLSMWRGYGGFGKGAALVIDTSSIPMIESSPFAVSRVRYGTAEDRRQWLEAKLAQFAQILAQSQIQDDQLYVAAYAIFERIKLFALFTKHSGFAEEREWRVVYLKDRDKDGRLHSMLDYFISPTGIEPKLKFKVGPIDGVTGDELSLSEIIDRIIVGPSASSPMEIHAIRRMLDRIGKSELIERVVRSSTPFRPT